MKMHLLKSAVIALGISGTVAKAELGHQLDYPQKNIVAVNVTGDAASVIPLTSQFDKADEDYVLADAKAKLVRSETVILGLTNPNSLFAVKGNLTVRPLETDAGQAYSISFLVSRENLEVGANGVIPILSSTSKFRPQLIFAGYGYANHTMTITLGQYDPVNGPFSSITDVSFPFQDLFNPMPELASFSLKDKTLIFRDDSNSSGRQNQKSVSLSFEKVPYKSLSEIHALPFENRRALALTTKFGHVAKSMILHENTVNIGNGQYIVNTIECAHTRYYSLPKSMVSYEMKVVFDENLRSFQLISASPVTLTHACGSEKQPWSR